MGAVAAVGAHDAHAAQCQRTAAGAGRLQHRRRRVGAIGHEVDKLADELCTRQNVQKAAIVRVAAAGERDIPQGQAAVNQFEKGSRKPNMPILRKLAKVLDVSIDYLVGESEEENEVKVQNEWQEFYRGFSELTDKDREILKAQMDILKERSKSDD